MYFFCFSFTALPFDSGRSVHGDHVQVRDAGDQHSRDSAHQSRQHGAAAQVARRRQYARVQFHGRAAARQFAEFNVRRRARWWSRVSGTVFWKTLYFSFARLPLLNARSRSVPQYLKPCVVGVYKCSQGRWVFAFVCSRHITRIFD
jgi:hypothetical protein